MLTTNCRSKAYKSVNPECASSEATKHAKSTEENARKSALTRVSLF